VLLSSWALSIRRAPLIDQHWGFKEACNSARHHRFEECLLTFLRVLAVVVRSIWRGEGTLDCSNANLPRLSRIASGLLDFRREATQAGPVFCNAVSDPKPMNAKKTKKLSRIPNWLTVPAFALSVAANTFLYGWSGLEISLLGTMVGLGLLLPFVLLRILGAGDWKLAGALGAFTGPGLLIDLLLLSAVVAGLPSLKDYASGPRRPKNKQTSHVSRSLCLYAVSF
jgi:hypothetical protein